MYKIDNIKCPLCREEANGTLESLEGRGELNTVTDQPNTYELGDETEVFWETADRTNEFETHIHLLCPNGHDWWAPYVEIE